MKTLSHHWRRSASFVLVFASIFSCFSIYAPAYEKSPRARLRFDLSQINRQIVNQFVTAWRQAKYGTNEVEAVVLIVRSVDGSIDAVMPRRTNEWKQLSFTWRPDIIAVVHTHPNVSPPEPLEDDRKIANKYDVPMFTITSRGMYLYDSRTKKTTLVKQGLDWIHPEKWEQKN